MKAEERIAEFRKRLDALRVLETDFPVFTENGDFLGRKCHYLLTYTRKELPFPLEEHQLAAWQIRELLGLARDVLEIAEQREGK